jgi:mannose-6-phosphate isomerase-like protein (cupin superfamily)
MKNLINNNRNFVSKGWGYEDWINNNDYYCGKILFLKKNKKLSFHYHKIKDETFYIQKGAVTLYLYNNLNEKLIKEFEENISWDDIFSSAWVIPIYLEEGDSYHIPINTRHCLHGNYDSYIIEFSTHHDDNDSYRILKGD